METEKQPVRLATTRRHAMMNLTLKSPSMLGMAAPEA